MEKEQIRIQKLAKFLEHNKNRYIIIKFKAFLDNTQKTLIPGEWELRKLSSGIAVKGNKWAFTLGIVENAYVSVQAPKEYE